MEKIKALLDLRATWTAIGLIAGTMFGEQGVAAVNALGLVVMAVL